MRLLNVKKCNHIYNHQNFICKKQLFEVKYLPLAGVKKPVGVRGRDPPLGVATPSLLALAAARAIDVFVFVTLRIGMRDGVDTSSKEWGNKDKKKYND